MINENLQKYMKIFLEENSKLNLISKNDEKVLWEKHVYDSLAISKFFEKYGDTTVHGTLLDIGTGGGFPSVPLAVQYPELKVTALDSIRKKINAINNIKDKLELTNLTTICERAERVTGQKFDVITSRAVAALKLLIPYAMPLLKPNGYFVAYKSLKVQEEIAEAKPILAKFKAEIIDILEYDLPLPENHTRNLVIIKHKS